MLKRVRTPLKKASSKKEKKKKNKKEDLKNERLKRRGEEWRKDIS